MKKIVKFIAQLFYSWKQYMVEDVYTHEIEIATTHQFFLGIVMKTTYKAL